LGHEKIIHTCNAPSISITCYYVVSSLYNFINKFTGQLSKAKEIRMATAREEDGKEAIVN